MKFVCLPEGNGIYKSTHITSQGAPTLKGFPDGFRQQGVLVASFELEHSPIFRGKPMGH
jgi:hypothetical protein